MRTSVALTALAVLLVAVTVSAAPANNSNQNVQDWVDQIKQFWSGIELWLYKLLHGGRNPPGYPGTPSSSSSASASKTVSVRTTWTASVKATLTSTVFTTTSAAAVVTSSAVPTSTVSSAVAFATSSAGAEDPLPSKGVSICASPASQFELSCSAKSLADPDTCCNTNPGGHLLLTQFWDAGATTSTGPADSWTIHGLWPDNCDGTYESNCDPSRAYSNITAILQSYEQTELLSYMNTYWKDGNGDDQSFWEHENSKHGTCISSLEPRCFVDYTPQEEAVYFFRRAVELHKTLNSYDVLAAAGILPSFTQKYALADLQAAVTKQHGFPINFQCTKAGVLNELWYHYVTRGSAADGDFIPADIVGSPSTCPATGIKYPPKYAVDPSTPTGTASGATPSSTKAASGFVYAVGADGVVPSGTCLISSGSWYKGGTCAGYTPTTIIGGSVTLTTSKGLCAVASGTNLLSCNASVDKNTAAQFVVGDDGTLNLGGSTAFSAAEYPSGSTQVPVYKGAGQAIPLTLKYVAK